MATIYPSEALQSSPRSEIKVRESLSAVDDLIVFHSAAWQSRRSGRQSDGEADFVILAPRLGVLILEVKGGGIDVIGGSWRSTDRNGICYAIKNPFDQAKDSKYALLSFFKAVEPDLARYPIVHAVVFPDIEVGKALGFNAPRELIVDRLDLTRPAAAIERIFLHWGQGQPLLKHDIQRIVSHLAPTFRVRRLLRDEVGDVDQALTALTTEQVRVLQSIRRIKHAVILGGAGTGKTVLAVEKARQLASTGFRTLLLCYNAPLRQHLESVLANTSVDVETFHSLTLRQARLAKSKTPFNPSSNWFEAEAPLLLRNIAESSGVRYDAVLVDEAQDFAMDWLSSVRSMLALDGLLYLFADSHQDIYRRGWLLPEGLNEFELSVNCRNTRPIAQKVANVFGDSLDGKQVEGPEPRFIEVDRHSQIVPYIVDLVESIVLEERIEPAQVIVLTDSTSIVSELRSIGVAGYLFTTLDGHGIPVETLYRFKGLERDVVVLALSDAIMRGDLQAAAYVGLSRAKAGLYVVGSSKVRLAIPWGS